MRKEKKAIVRIRDKHEITLPKEIREQLNWKSSDYLSAKCNREDNTVVLKKIEL